MALMEMCDDHGYVPPACGPWAGRLEVMADLRGHIAHRFVRTEVHERAHRYVLGLLRRIERKNG
jgi:hypothetical protein